MLERVEVGQLFGAVPANSRGLLVVDDSVTSDRPAAEPHRQVLADVAVGIGDLAKRDPGKTINGDTDSGFFEYLAHRRICRLFARIDRARRQRPVSIIGTTRRLATYSEIATRKILGWQPVIMARACERVPVTDRQSDLACTFISTSWEGSHLAEDGSLCLDRIHPAGLGLSVYVPRR